jgi:hypothetical protein
MYRLPEGHQAERKQKDNLEEEPEKRKRKRRRKGERKRKGIRDGKIHDNVRGTSRTNQNNISMHF